MIHQGALGDWVLTFPLLRALPGGTIAVTAGEKARLAARLISGIEPIDIESSDFTLLHTRDAWQRISSGGRTWMDAVDGWVISFVSDGRDAWGENARRLFPRARLGFVQPRPPSDWREHVTRWHAAQLKSQGLRLEKVPVMPRLNPHGPVVIHPGSGGAAKCWPRERFEQLIAAFRDRGEIVKPLLGEVELETWPPTEVQYWREAFQAEAITSLDLLADVLGTARIYIGNDSGPTHLAAQMGLPTVALFGPTDPRVWSPAGPQVCVLAPPTPQAMTWLSVEHVCRHLPSHT